MKKGKKMNKKILIIIIFIVVEIGTIILVKNNIAGVNFFNKGFYVYVDESGLSYNLEYGQLDEETSLYDNTTYSKVLAETNIKEKSSGSFPNYDVTVKTYIFARRVYIVAFIFFLIYCIDYEINGTRYISNERYGGIVKEKDINYCREIPQYIDLELAYVSLYHCSKISTKKLKNGIIGAFILKWSNDNNIIVTDKGNRVWSINLLDGNFKKTKAEQELYDLLKTAAGSNNIIDNNELKAWSRSHKNILEKWHEKLLQDINNVNLKSEAEALMGLKKFLLDYSLIDEKKHIDVKIWENYLIYAQLMGITNETTKQFAKIYPDYSKIGQLSVMNIDELVFEPVIIIAYWLLPMALAMFPTVIISGLYYIIHLVMGIT